MNFVVNMYFEASVAIGISLETSLFPYEKN